MDDALQVQKLTKIYTKAKAANEVEFSIARGEIFALIGPNGAGKTTTLRMVATLLKPTSGDALVGGVSVVKHPQQVREQITYLPDEAGAYKNMKGIDYLKFMASLFSSRKEEIQQYVETGVKIADLGNRIQDKIGSYSRGMTRRLLLARAVMTKPTLAILDEPTSGLDILNALEIRRMIRQLADEGMSFLISSHNMLEIEYLSDRVGIISGGVLHVTGTPEELKAKYEAANLEEVFEQAVHFKKEDNIHE
ncbi:MAG: ABC transporter ATP-binding protein [Massiliimalia sp.]|jgi:ABC-2 type transport system ATP-binding protein